MKFTPVIIRSRSALLTLGPQRVALAIFLCVVALLGCEGELRPGGDAPASSPVEQDPAVPASSPVEQEPATVNNIVGCAMGSTDCGGSCVSTLNDPENCGACGMTCGAGQLCQAGACVAYCTAGETECNGICESTVSNPSHCGGCGMACLPGEYCDTGTCSATCTGELCPDGLGGEQCVHVESNNDHCGGCGIRCPDGQACQAGTCMDACPEGWIACGNGCIDVRTNATHCGACGNACGPGVSCIEGACGGTEPVCDGGACACADSQTYCNEACVDTLSNSLHCGGCGLECATGQTCVGGICECAAGQQLCDAACTDTLTDSSNCGACGTVCSGGTTCQAGECACEAGLSICNDSCVDQQTDPENCGGCGIACAGYESCVAGICKYDEDQCGGDARDISVSRVALYQAVELDLFDEGAMVSAEQRAVDVIQDRDAMVRVFVEPEPGFAPRELSARMFVDNEGEIEAFFHKRTVSGVSNQGTLDSTFMLDVPAEAIGPSTNYWVELVECGELPEGTVGTVRVPPTAEENAALSARPTGVIKVVFVPVTHDGRTPDVAETTMAAYARGVELRYPTTGVEWSVRDPIQSNQSGTNISLGTTLDLVTEQRSDDNVESDVYYYGIIDPAETMRDYCGGGCTTGIAWLTGASGGWASNNRAGVGIGFETRGVGTFAHELGHNHGREHAPCGVDSGDTSYPHAGAGIGMWGYDLDQQELKDPEEYTDFMSYCSPNWVSDYSYNAYADRIAILNGVESMQASVVVGPTRTWYRMTVTEKEAHWSKPWTGQGTPGTSVEAAFVYDSAGTVIAMVDAYRVEMSHSDGYQLYVPEPQAHWFALRAKDGTILAF